MALVSWESLGKYSLFNFLEEVYDINNTCFLDICQRSTVNLPGSEVAGGGGDIFKLHVQSSFYNGNMTTQAFHFLFSMFSQLTTFKKLPISGQLACQVSHYPFLKNGANRISLKTARTIELCLFLNTKLNAGIHQWLSECFFLSLWPAITPSPSDIPGHEVRTPPTQNTEVHETITVQQIWSTWCKLSCRWPISKYTQLFEWVSFKCTKRGHSLSEHPRASSSPSKPLTHPWTRPQRTQIHEVTIGKVWL